MQIPLLAVFAILAAGLTLSAYWIFVSIPRDLTSLFRYRLWRIRDDCMDDLLSGRIEDAPQARRHIETVEGVIRDAPLWTPFQIAVLLWSTWDGPTRDKVLRRSRSRPQAAPLTRHEKRWLAAMIRHFLFGSPSGWVLAAVLFGLVLPLAYVLGKAHRLKMALRHSFTMVAEATIGGGGGYGPRGPLSACM